MNYNENEVYKRHKMVPHFNTVLKGLLLFNYLSAFIKVIIRVGIVTLHLSRLLLLVFVDSEHIFISNKCKISHKVRTQLTVWTEMSVFKSQHSANQHHTLGCFWIQITHLDKWGTISNLLEEMIFLWSFGQNQSVTEKLI